MLKKEDLINVNSNFSNGEISKEDVLNFSILKINNSDNHLDQMSHILNALLSENCFKDGNKETAVSLVLAMLESKNLPVNQDKLLNMVLNISKNNIMDRRRIIRMLKEVI